MPTEHFDRYLQYSRAAAAAGGTAELDFADPEIAGWAADPASAAGIAGPKPGQVNRTKQLSRQTSCESE